MARWSSTTELLSHQVKIIIANSNASDKYQRINYFPIGHPCPSVYTLLMKLWTFLVDEQALEALFSHFPLWSLILIVGVTILVLSKGADWMIDGAVSLALRTGMSQIVIGATILSLGTTMPEAFVSVMAAFTGNPGLALGNGVGSIIADTGLIFGLTALVAAPSINRRLLNRTGRWQIGSALLLVLLAALAFFLLPGEPVISRWMGILLVTLLVVYMINTYLWSRQNGVQDSPLPSQAGETEAEVPASLPVALLMLIGGLVLVITASRLIVPSAGEIARRLRVPEDVIAATMVALGTSLPELSTAIAAMRKGRPELTIGNIVGADVLNVLFVIGAASLAEPLVIPPTFFRFHFPAMLVILLSFRLFTVAGKTRFRRWQGAWLLLLYTVYIALQYILK